MSVSGDRITVCQCSLRKGNSYHHLVAKEVMMANLNFLAAWLLIVMVFCAFVTRQIVVYNFFENQSGLTQKINVLT